MTAINADAKGREVRRRWEADDADVEKDKREMKGIADHRCKSEF